MIRRLSPLVVLLAWLSATGAAAAGLTPDVADQQFARANQAFLAGDFPQARRLFAAIDAAGYGGGDLYYNLGVTCLKMKDAGFAIYYFERAAIWDHSPDVKAGRELAQAQAAELRGQAAQKLVTADEISGWRFFLRLARWRWLPEIFLFFWAGCCLAWLWRLLAAPTGRAASRLALLCLVLALITACGVAGQWYFTARYQVAIVTAAAPVRAGPNPAFAVDYTLAPGSECLVQQRFERWTQIRLGNGLVTWVDNDQLAYLWPG